MPRLTFIESEIRQQLRLRQNSIQGFLLTISEYPEVDTAIMQEALEKLNEAFVTARWSIAQQPK